MNAYHNDRDDKESSKNGDEEKEDIPLVLAVELILLGGSILLGLLGQREGFGIRLGIDGLDELLDLL